MPDFAPHQHHRINGSTAAAILFVTISAALSALILQRSFQPLSPSNLSPKNTEPIEQAQPTSTQELIETKPTQNLALTPTLATNQANVILLGGLSKTDDTFAISLQDALERTFKQAFPDVTYTFQVLDNQIANLPSVSDISQDYPGAGMLIAWQTGENGLTTLYIVAASHPAQLQVEEALQPWDIPSPEHFPILINGADDLTFAALTAAAVVNLQNDHQVAAQQQIATILTTGSNLPPGYGTQREAVVQFLNGQIKGQDNSALALRAYSEALRLGSGFTAAEINRGNIYLEIGDLDAALVDYNAALEIEPDRLGVLYNRVLVYNEKNDLDSALLEALHLVQVEPNSGWAHNLAGLIYYQRSELDQALTSFEKAVSLSPDDPAPLYNLAVTQYQMSDFAEALQSYDLLLDLAPKIPLYHLHQALTYQAAGQYPPAERSFNHALELDPTYLEAYLLRGQLHLITKAYDRAQVDSQKALEINPDEGEAYEILGDAELNKQAWNAAIDAYNKAIELDAASAEIYAARGLAWHQLRYIPYAVRDYDEALRQGFSGPEFLYRYGFALFDSGRYNDSLEVLLGAVNSGVETADAHAILGVALDANRRKDDADTEYRRAIEMDKRYEDTDYLKEQQLWSAASIQRAEIIIKRINQ